MTSPFSTKIIERFSQFLPVKIISAMTAKFEKDLAIFLIKKKLLILFAFRKIGLKHI